MENSAAVAEAVIGQINSQIDLLFTIASAFCGGIVALSVQILFHNRDPDAHSVKIEAKGLAFATFAAEGISVFFGYLARSVLTSATPNIFKVMKTFTGTESWAKAEFEGHSNLRNFMGLQFIAFMVGVVLLSAVLYQNRRIFQETKE